jgi:hypothetical protein
MAASVVALHPGAGAAAAALPAPLVPAGTDLCGQAVSMDMSWLLETDTWLVGTPAEAKAAATLAMRSLRQVPAGSLPDDDRMLAALSGAGEAWAEVRAGALSGWIRCSDGRLYHPAIAAQVLRAREVKDGQARREREAAWKREWRAKQKADPAGAGSEREGASARVSGRASMDMSVDASMDMSGGRVRGRVRSDTPPPPSSRPPIPPLPPAPPSPPYNPPHPSSPAAPAARAEVGPPMPLPDRFEAFRDRKRPWLAALARVEASSGRLCVGPHDPADDVARGSYIDDAENLVLEAAGLAWSWRGSTEPLARWLAEGLDLHDVVLEAIRAAARKPGYKPPASLKFFEGFVRVEAERHAARNLA